LTFLRTRVAQNARGVVNGVVKGVTRASFGRRAPLTPQPKRASARRREEKVFRGVYMIQQVAAVHLGYGWGLAPSLDTNLHMRALYGCHLAYIASIEGATWGVVRAFWLPNGASVRRLIRRAPLTPPK